MQSKESDINEIMEQIVQFSEDRDWDQFHNGKVRKTIEIIKKEILNSFRCDVEKFIL